MLDGINVVNADGTNLTHFPNNAFGPPPVWTPNGKKIAFVTSDYEIYTINADGTDPTRITSITDSTGLSAPIFSPDGKKIAYLSWPGNIENPNTDSEIYVMNADGTGQVRLTDNVAAEEILNWVPAGLPDTG